ncbi:tRNA (cytidine(34)-2'-O)-methyltransferase [Mesorhizobium sophorae]|uniref:tRNA (cytidine(34)-2'-O)-methyltransferase n=1 Tax=Mesorhizobium sophorae TaxID=1300294 RepID=UPI000BA3518A|nr:tRNA (cytidine(34)-2'-O)-methyltransferase [Mesorhizobium sophorae]
MNDRLRIALYQPDIAGNTGTILRFAACLGLGVDIIEPAGFPISDRALKRAGMDYLEMADLTRHVDWHAFEDWRRAGARRLVLLSTKAAIPYTSFAFASGDILLFGRESAGVPDAVHQAADARLTIPMQGAARSINVALSVAMVAGEAVRQLGCVGR